MEPPPTECRRAIAAGWAAIVLAFGSLLSWSMLAPLSMAVIAPGVIVVDGQRRAVEHLKGGYVSELRVREGDRVAAGQVLITLSAAETWAELATLRERRRANRAREARLLAERHGLGTIAFGEELRADAAAREIIDTEVRLFEVRRARLYGDIDLLRSKRDQSQAEVAGLRVQRIALERQLHPVEEELAGVRRLHERGYATVSRVRELEREREALRGEYGELTAAAEQAQGAVAAVMLQLLQLERQFNEEVETELDALRRGDRELDERLHAAAEEDERLAIRAPVAGTVVDLAMAGPGEVVKPGERVLDIVPADDQPIVEAKVLPAEANGLRAGLPAEVRIQTPNGGDAIHLTGEVSVVSADRLTDPKTNAPYFLVQVILEEELDQTPVDAALKPGLPVEVIISKGERTALSYLSEPLARWLIHAFRE